MHETDADITSLQELLDHSYDAAGEHLRRITTPERRVSAVDLARRLSGMCLLALATSTADGRPIVGPVDSVFYRGAFHFGSAPDSVRARHLRTRPALSATHLPGEEFAVTVHGQAEPVDVRAPEGVGLRETLLEIYVPRYGPDWVKFLDGSEGGPELGGAPRYWRIEAERIFSFRMAPASAENP
ncbi:MAG: pyridoxamine 5'-phosphate oxidase family protein [Actinomycetota bacterium]|nr:pyridoxamine 5'-phosphate oxidase family protein [Actinomycetota bacterium]